MIFPHLSVHRAFWESVTLQIYYFFQLIKQYQRIKVSQEEGMMQTYDLRLQLAKIYSNVHCNAPLLHKTAVKIALGIQNKIKFQRMFCRLNKCLTTQAPEQDAAACGNANNYKQSVNNNKTTLSLIADTKSEY